MPVEHISILTCFSYVTETYDFFLGVTQYIHFVS